MSQKLLTTATKGSGLLNAASRALRPTSLGVRQSTLAAQELQPRDRVTPVRVGDRFLMDKRTFTQQDMLTYSLMTQNPLPDANTKPVVYHSLIYSAFSGCADQFMNSKETVTVLLNYSSQHPEPLFVGEEMQAELRVVAREGRKVKLQLLSTELSRGKVVGQAVADCLMPKGYPE